ncbi:MAG: hypothetical protein H6678_07975 [Candidatus Delongbacteria bacterium]|nr:hypothetical protein [Candidatus Delongbacteria bacterium]
MVQFDSEDPFERVHHFLPLPLVPRLTRETFVPRGATPLLDAMGRGILDLDGSLEALGAAERPGRIVFVVVTDGEENSSREFTHARVRALIEERRESHGWQFVFLSADMAAIADARATGFMASSTLAFSADSAGSQMAWGALSDSLSAYRENRLSEMTLEPRPDKS